MTEPGTGPGVSLDADALTDAAAAYAGGGVSELELRLFDEIGPRIRADGHATKADLDDVCRWRAQRASGFVARNDPAEVVEITRLAFAPGVTDRVRLKLLTLLDGISERTASILLAMWGPDRYAAWDESGAGVLVAAGRVGDASLPVNWTAYLDAVRSLADGAAMSLRDAERALFVLGGGDPAAAVGAGSRSGAPRRSGVEVDRARVGDPDDEAGAALASQLSVHRAGVRDFDATRAKARETLAISTPEQRRLLLGIHRRLSEQMFPKASRDLGWLYYANDVGSGLVGEVALRVPRGVHELRLVAYLPVDVATGELHGWFEPSSATQKKAQIPPDAVDVDALAAVFETARRWVLTRRG
ncbi:MAG: hypothetical protein U0U69_14855 [Acidimicrobiia bacterium]